MADLFSKLQFSNLQKNPKRLQKFVEKFNAEEDFTTVDGKKKKIKEIEVKKERYKPGDGGLLLVIYDSSLRGTDVKFYNGGEIKINTLAKTEEFGGQSKANGGKQKIDGKTTEVLSETAFCFYYALLLTRNLDKYSVESWKTVTNTPQFQKLCKKFNGVHSMLSYQFNDAKALDKDLKLMYTFLTQEGWDDIARRQVKAFKAKFPAVTKGYFIARPSGMDKSYSPYVAFNNIRESLKGYVGLDRQINENKWNPADFWIFNSRGLKFMEMWNKKANELKSIKSETYSASYMNLVNNQVYKLFEKNMLFPVSLKKSGTSVKIVKVNDKNTNIDQIVEYDRVLLDPNNQDVQIFYNLSTYEDNKLLSKKELKAKMKTAKGGFRLELEEVSNATARHGSVGVGLQQYIIYNTNDSGISKLNEIRKEFNEDDMYQYLPRGSSENWMGVNRYSKIGNEAAKLLPYVNRMMEEINGADSKFNDRKYAGQGSYATAIATKAGAGELAIAVTKIINKFARDIVVENLHLAAGSGGIRVGASPDQLKRRARLLGMKEDEMILVDDIKDYENLLSGCFHLKVM